MIGSFGDILGDSDVDSGVETAKSSWWSAASSNDLDEEDEEKSAEANAALEQFAAELEELLGE